MSNQKLRNAKSRKSEETSVQTEKLEAVAIFKVRGRHAKLARLLRRRDAISGRMFTQRMIEAYELMYPGPDYKP